MSSRTCRRENGVYFGHRQAVYSAKLGALVAAMVLWNLSDICCNNHLFRVCNALLSWAGNMLSGRHDAADLVQCILPNPQ